MPNCRQTVSLEQLNKLVADIEIRKQQIKTKSRVRSQKKKN